MTDLVLNKIHPPDVFAHRTGRFLDMGFDQHDADLLANTRHDTHAVRRMLTSGCPVRLAIEILL